MVLSGIALYGSSDLSAGSLKQIGPGMLPRALGVLLGIIGIAQVVGALIRDGASMDRWQWRGAVFVLGAALVFAFAIRPLGILVAVPAAMLLAAFASDESTWKETLVFAVLMTAGCYLLFKTMLGLPIPVAPWLLDY